MGEEAGEDKKFDPQRAGVFPPVKDDERERYRGCIVLVAYVLGVVALVALVVGVIVYARRVLG